MSFSTVLAINLAVLTIVLLSDLGLKAVGRERLVRPLIACAITAAFCIRGVPTAGDGLLLVVGGLAAGVLGGLGVVSLLRLESGVDGVVRTRGGAVYAAVWVAIVGARLAFSFGAEHWFRTPLGRVMMEHQITVAALTDALVLMALAMVVTRTLVLAGRVRSARPVLQLA